MTDMLKLIGERYRQMNKARRMIKFMREAAQKADDGHWIRSHSQIISCAPSNVAFRSAHMVALTEFFPELKRVGCGYALNPEKDMPNGRHIVATQPRKLLELIEVLENLFPELMESEDGQDKVST